MIIYIIRTKYMGGIQAEAVFSSRENAQLYLEKRNSGQGGGPEIIEVQVAGEMEEFGKVFTASFYDRGKDIHVLQGVYGSHREAERQAGENGEVLSKIVDEKIV